MSRARILPFVVLAVFIASACAGTAATTAPSVAPQSATPASEAPASEAPASAPASAAAAPCAPSDATGTVSVKIANFAFDPAQVTAKVGDTITWTNNDSTGHTATVKGNESCTTPTITGGNSSSITFTQAGTYDFFCKIHPQMTGKIEVTS